MNIISKELHRIKPDILLYGEGWTAGASPLPDSLRAIKKNAHLLDRIAVFSDDIRDGIKGSVFNHDEKGFASGRPGMEESIKFGVVAALQHPQVNYKKVNYSKAPYASQPWQTVSYAECHDNHVLWDKLTISAKSASVKEREEMYKLALSIVLTSQGIAFLHAGSEFIRSKKGVENSFESPDSINQIDWSLKTKNKEMYEYVRSMIRLRKEHPSFRMTTAEQIVENLRFLENTPAGMVAYTINGKAVKDTWKRILVVYNGNPGRSQLSIPTGKWKMFDPHSGVLLDSKASLPPYSCTIFYEK
jgi:pullulanase